MACLDLSELSEIELIRHEMDLAFYANVASWMLVGVMLFSLIYFALPYGMEMEIARSEQVLIDACNAGKVSQKYCVRLRV